jgi:AraC-like DNA-binding protein
MRTARSRTSFEYRFAVPINPILSQVGVSGKAGAVQTLSDLAEELRVSTHLASELLNVHLDSSFYEFLNRHRAAEAAELLRAGKGGFSIADIAYEAGFNNPNTFYKEFRKVRGVTPAQFRRQLKRAAGESGKASGNGAPH